MEPKVSIKEPLLFFLILLISFPSVIAVIITPALPMISDVFAVSNGYTQQLMTLFIIGYAFGQLLYPPFANRYGRKIAIYLGIGLFLLSSLVCLFGIQLHQLDTILFGRFFMALGSSVGMTISFTIISDFYDAEKARSIVGYTILAYAVMPALAIMLGGLITTYISWTSCFYFCLIYGLIILAISIRLPETLSNKKYDALKLKPLLTSYCHAFSCWRLILFSAIYGLMATFIYVIASGSPFIGIDTIGLTPEHYGVLLLIPYMGQLIGAFFAGKMGGRLSCYQIMACGYSCTTMGSVLMFVLFLFNWINVISLILPTFIIMLGLPMTYSGAVVMAQVGYPDKATASSIMSFITMFTALMATFLLTLLPNHNPIIMPSLFMVTLLIALVAFYHAYHKYRQ